MPDMVMSSDAVKNRTYSDGLRALAGLIDAHPCASGSYEQHRHLICVRSREALAGVVRDLGGRWEKGSQAGAFDDHYFEMTRDLGGGVTVMVFAPSASVCERVVVGTETVEIPDPDLVAEVPTMTVEREIVEWRCPDSVLRAGTRPCEACGGEGGRRHYSRGSVMPDPQIEEVCDRCEGSGREGAI